MRQVQARGSKLAAGAPASGTAPGVGKEADVGLRIQRGEELLAWSKHHAIDVLEGHTVVVTRCLCLGQTVTLDLVSGLPFAAAFSYAVITHPKPQEFVVVHATFELYRTGRPEISDFAVVLPNPEAPAFRAARMIQHTAQMLRKGSTP
jgi:hypothetical protein